MTTSLPQKHAVVAEHITANGGKVPVCREDCADQIQSTASNRGIDNDEAWEQIKVELGAFLEGKSLPRDWYIHRASSRKKTADKTSTAVGDPLIFIEIPSENEVPQATDEQLKRKETSNHEEPKRSNDLPPELSDELLPAHLKTSGIPVMDAISKGLIKIPGEHPDAELLRSSICIAQGSMFSPSQANEEAHIVKLVRGRQFQFSFKGPESVRIMPTDFNQTSLFHVASNNVPRRLLKNEMLGRIGDALSIHFHGEELRHDDEGIFMQLIHLARGKAPYEWIYIDNAPFFRGAHGATRILGSKDSASIDASLERMRGAYVMVRNTKRKVFITINLIRDLQGAGSSRRVLIDPCMVALLDSYTVMDQQTLYEVKGAARQLFKYISTKPFSKLYPTKVTSFFELCYGSIDALIKHYLERNPTKSPAEAAIAISKKVSDFRRKTLPAALEDLKERDLLVSYEFLATEDKVVIEKKLAAGECL
jgi:hypothetical protein